jgi:hypothetical protein
MDVSGIDVLVMQNSNEFSGGYVKWFTDLPAGNGTMTTVIMPKDATVTIRSQRNDAKTVVKTDESGTYVIVATPKKKLTAHDPDGKVLFDGEIETSEQQKNVPRAVWEKVQPMLEKLNQTRTLETEPEKERVPGTQSATEPESDLPSSS